MNELPFEVDDLVRRTAIDYAPDLDAEMGVTREMVGLVVGIDHSTPMFAVLWDELGDEGLYLPDELEKVGQRMHDKEWFSNYKDVMI